MTVYSLKKWRAQKISNKKQNIIATSGVSKKGSSLPPLPLGRGVCETKSKNGRSRPRRPFISRVFCARRGNETMVSEGARPWGRGRSEFAKRGCFFMSLKLFFASRGYFWKTAFQMLTLEWQIAQWPFDP